MSNYIKQNFIGGQILKAEHLNHIEDGITSILPSVQGNEKYLAIDKNGEMIWEDRYGYAYTKENWFLPEQTFSSIFGVIGPKFLLNPTVGETYDVICNGVVYPAECRDIGGGVLYFGNLALSHSGSDTGELFCIMGATINLQTMAFIDQSISQSSNTIAVRGIEEIITKIPGKYIAGGISLGKGRNSCVLNGLISSAAQGNESVVINNGRANGPLSFAANYGLADGFNSASFGWSVASGDFSFAGGGSRANGDYSCAFGSSTTADGEKQFVIGERNIVDSENKYAYIIGNGRLKDSETQEIIPSNAHTVDWDGNGWFAGTVEGTAMIIKSPNGTRFKITVSDEGTLSAAAITE